MRKRKRHGSYKFTEKTHSKRGIVATVLALALLVLYLVILELAFRANGGLSAYYGSIDDARAFFGKESMEDVVMSVNSKEQGGEGLAEQYIERYAALAAAAEGGAAT